MEKYIVCRINTGKALHIAKSFKTPSNVKGYDIQCGSNNSGLKARIHLINVEVTKENITCKKCLARIEASEKESNVESEKETQEYKLIKLKEYVEKEEAKRQEKEEIRAALKKAFENKESFIMKK